MGASDDDDDDKVEVVNQELPPKAKRRRRGSVRNDEGPSSSSSSFPEPCPKCSFIGLTGAKECLMCHSSFVNFVEEGSFQCGFVLNSLMGIDGTNLITSTGEKQVSVRIPDLTRAPGLQEAWVASMGIQSAESFFKLFPDFKSVPNLLVSDQNSKGLVERWESEMKKYNANTKCFLPDTFGGGTMHSKFFVLFYEERVRLVIHTANLIRGDLFHKTNAAWFQDFRIRSGDESHLGVNQQFQIDLLDFFKHFFKGAPSSVQRERRLEKLRCFDFTTSKVALIASVPGSHDPSSGPNYGSMKMRSLLDRFIPKQELAWPVVCQFTSLGSMKMSGSSRSWALAEFLWGRDKVHFVFPSDLDCQRSIIGFPDGIFLSNSKEDAFVSEMKQRMCWWKGNDHFPARHNAYPHLKSYVSFDPEDSRRLSFAIITSHNLSKAAWGHITKKGKHFIKSFELGVFFAPTIFNPSKTVRFVSHRKPNENESENEIILPVPFQLPPKLYDFNLMEFAPDGSYGVVSCS